MPSPFPGMNPYLEQIDVWQDLHDSMIPAIRDALAAQLSSNYVVKIEQSLFIHEPSAELRLLLGKADVGVASYSYCMMVSRCEERPEVLFWPLRLREPLPLVPIPLLPPHGHVELDLQAVLHGVYDRARYGNYICQDTPYPPLGPEDAAWAASLISSPMEKLT